MKVKSILNYREKDGLLPDDVFLRWYQTRSANLSINYPKQVYMPRFSGFYRTSGDRVKDERFSYDHRMKHDTYDFHFFRFYEDGTVLKTFINGTADHLQHELDEIDKYIPEWFGKGHKDTKSGQYQQRWLQLAALLDNPKGPKDLKHIPYVGYLNHDSTSIYLESYTDSHYYKFIPANMCP